MYDIQGACYVWKAYAISQYTWALTAAADVSLTIKFDWVLLLLLSHFGDANILILSVDHFVSNFEIHFGTHSNQFPTTPNYFSVPRKAADFLAAASIFVFAHKRRRVA